MAKEIVNEFKLKPEEAVILRKEKVAYGSPIPTKNNELILTNQDLIHIRKDMFGKTKEVIRYPLTDICMSAGKPQLVIGAGSNVDGPIDIYLQYETLHFKLEWRDDAVEFIDTVTETITGVKVEKKNDMNQFDDLLSFASSVTGTINDLKKAFGIKSTEAAACKCSSCGASLSGIEDEVIICPYCGTSNKL